jgi:hypothetical protein
MLTLKDLQKSKNGIVRLIGEVLADYLGVVHADDGTLKALTVPLLLPDGSASAPSLAFTTATTTGLFRSAADTLGLVAGGVERLRVSGGNIRIANNTIGFSGASLGTADLEILRGGAPGALRITTGTTPTLSGCGTSPTITGNNSLGTVVIGTTPGTCVVTFNGTWTNIPKCWLNNRTSAVANRATSNSTTAFTMAGTIAASDTIDYHCFSE